MYNFDYISDVKVLLLASRSLLDDIRKSEFALNVAGVRVFLFLAFQLISKKCVCKSESFKNVLTIYFPPLLTM